MRRRAWQGRCGLAFGALGPLGCGPIEVESSTCDVGAVPIAEVQGAGPVSPRLEQWVDVTGAVSLSGVRLANHTGFFLQTEGVQPAAGLFVVAGGNGPEAGDRLRVRGRVEEIGGVTALGSVESLEPCGKATLEPLDVVLSGEADAERWEGVWVKSHQTWTLIDSSELESSGRLGLSLRQRLFAPGHPLASPAARWALQGLEGVAREWLQAGTLSAHLRLGAQASGLSAVVLGGAAPTLLATRAPDLRASPAPPPGPRLPGSLRVAALNLDNYFAEPGARGAQSALELSRQRSKLVAALRQLDADILALSELGAAAASSASDSPSLSDLLSALNASLPEPLAYHVSEGAAPSLGVLRSAIAHRPARVSPLGPAWFASSPAFRRAPAFQTFALSGHELTVGVVHLKSKLCNGAEQIVGPEGCGAEQRAAEAKALSALVPELPAELLLLGDFNSDAGEAPLLELKAAGLRDLFDTLPWADRYSYVFEGRAAQLDHALASPGLASSLAAAQIWHINADEPELLGYALSNPPEAYQPDARRSSDHDPILVDFAFEPPGL